MLVVEPTSARFEAADAGVLSNEHQLERVSATENRIGRLAERLERSLDLVLKQVQTSEYDRTLVTTLVELLAADGIIDKARLEQLWNERWQTPPTVTTSSKKDASRPGRRRRGADSAKKPSNKRSRN